MATVITIAGINRTSLIDWKSLSREEVLTRESNKLSFNIKKFNGQTYKPSVSDEVILTVNSIREFGGVITEISENIDGRLESIQITCKDYTHNLDRYLVSTSYDNQTVNYILNDILTNFTDGTYTGTGINCTAIIDKISFNYLSVSKSIEKITELVSGFDWYVDYNKDIKFFAVVSNLSSFNLTDTAGNYVFNSLEIKQDNNQLRNQIIIRGGVTISTATREELLTGDAGKYIFPLATKFSSTPTITVGGVSKTVGIENVDVAGFDVYWNYTEKTLKFITPPASATNNISVVGYYEYPLIIDKSDEASQTTYGVYQYVIVDKTIKDVDTANLRATVELTKYSQPLYSASFTTYTYGLKTGQYINIQSTIRTIDKNFKIQGIKTRLFTPNTDVLVHEIDAITTEDLGINDILTRLLVKNQADQIEVSQDEYISRIRGLSDSMTITDSTPTATTTAPPYVYGTATYGFATWS